MHLDNRSANSHFETPLYYLDALNVEFKNNSYKWSTMRFMADGKGSVSRQY